MKRMLQLIAINMSLSWGVMAEPIAYEIDQTHSSVGFDYTFGPDNVVGVFPEYSADLMLDLDKPSKSTVRVTLQTQSAKAGFVFATSAFRSARILDTKNHPTISFESTSVLGQGSSADIIGNITIRGVTRPITLTANLSRHANIEGRLNIRLRGSLNRHDFGASGYRNDVSDIINININAWIDET
jgi:polyisoprenoid-binding protein YceI